MKKYILFFIFSLFINIHYAISKDSFLSDEEITRRVNDLIVREKDVPRAHIKILTKNGIVGVYGSVDTNLQADKIIELIATITGVVDINTENLEIKNSKEFLSDAYITAKAKGKIKYLALTHKIAKDYELHIETTDGTVHIFGTVKNSKDINLIKKSVLNIIDVHKVKMNVKASE